MGSLGVGFTRTALICAVMRLGVGETRFPSMLRLRIWSSWGNVKCDLGSGNTVLLVSCCATGLCMCVFFLS